MNNFYINGKSDLFSNAIEELYADEITKLKDKYPTDKKDWCYSTSNITFQVTESCNLKCTYCYQICKTEHFMNFDTAKKLVDYILSDEYFNQFPTFSILLEFIGGEPFLAVDLMDQICEYFINEMLRKNHIWLKHFRFNITTNGTLYFDERVQKFIEKYNDFLSLTVTVDGCKDLHDSCRVFGDGKGSYDLAISAARDLMKKFNKNQATKLTISPDNMSYIPEAIKNFISEGFTDIFFNCIFEHSWTNEEAHKYYYILKEVADYLLNTDWFNDPHHLVNKFDQNGYRPIAKNERDINYCGGNGKMLAFDYKGNMFPCIRYMKSSLGNSVEPIIIGDLKTGLLKTPEYIKIYDELNSMTRSSQSEEKCMNCPIASSCGWCSAYNYQCFGELNKRSTNLCKMNIAESLINVYFWNKFYIKHHYNQIYMNHCPDEWALEIIDENELNNLKQILNDAINRDDEFDEVTATNCIAE